MDHAEQENDLKNAELSLEGQSGSYNMIDGLINNTPALRLDLTDGQSYEELLELASDFLPETKQSLRKQLQTYQEQQREETMQTQPRKERREI